MQTGGGDFFRQATLKLCSSLDIEKALLNSLSYLGIHLPAFEILLLVIDPKLRLVHNIATVNQRGIRKAFPPKYVSEDAIARINYDAAAWQEVKILDRLDLHPAGWILSDHVNLSTTSLMYMNLVIEGTGLGSVVFLAEGKGTFKKSHANLISQLREPFCIAASNALRYREVAKLKDILDAENQDLARDLRDIVADEVVGADCGLKDVMEMVRQVAPITSPVLLLGETGVGKEVIANALHYASTRKDKPLVTVNCGAIPESLMDSELFGHEKGAFTGAISQKKGRFERADKGSLFLDEVAELPPSVQVRLLRVLQNREIERVGGTETIPVDIRVIAATHRNLQEMVRAGKFREDLFFRLNIFPVMIPPLRHRREDIPALIHHFIQKKSKELKIHTPPPVSSAALERLKDYQWPGNVRELENLVERELITGRGPNGNGRIKFAHFRWSDHLKDADGYSKGNEPLLTLDEAMSRHIQMALHLTNGKIYGPDGAGVRLGINSNTLRSRMKKLGIDVNKQKNTRQSFR